jgi:ATP-dependent Clp protease ATP-binding subunit ClpA
VFERFTAPARAVVIGAQHEARELRHRHIGTEHVLLAMLAADLEGPAGRALRDAGVRAETVRAEVLRRVGPGQDPLGEADAEALKAIGIDLDAVREKIEESFGRGALDAGPECEQTGRSLFDRLRGRRRGPQPRLRGHIPFTPRAKKVLELSLREAIRLGDKEIRAEHILLGMLRDGGGLAVQILHESGVDLEDLRRRTEGGFGKAA